MKFLHTNQSLSGAVILAMLVMSSPSAGESLSKSSDAQELASGGAPGAGGSRGSGGSKGGGKATGGSRSGKTAPGVYDSDGVPQTTGGATGSGGSPGGTGGVLVVR